MFTDRRRATPDLWPARAQQVWELDGVTRRVAAPAPGGEGDELPSAAELAAREGWDAPVVRACVVCSHPLPKTIDRERWFTVVLLGPPASGKTSTLVSVVQHRREEGSRPVVRRGGRDRAATLIAGETASMHLLGRQPEIFERFARREPLSRTQRVRQHPIEFMARIEPDVRFGFQIVDLSGEDLVSPSAGRFEPSASYGPMRSCSWLIPSAPSERMRFTARRDC